MFHVISNSFVYFCVNVLFQLKVSLCITCASPQLFHRSIRCIFVFDFGVFIFSRFSVSAVFYFRSLSLNGGLAVVLCLSLYICGALCFQCWYIVLLYTIFEFNSTRHKQTRLLFILCLFHLNFNPILFSFATLGPTILWILFCINAVHLISVCACRL